MSGRRGQDCAIFFCWLQLKGTISFINHFRERWFFFGQSNVDDFRNTQNVLNFNRNRLVNYISIVLFSQVVRVLFCAQCHNCLLLKKKIGFSLARLIRILLIFVKYE